MPSQVAGLLLAFKLAGSDTSEIKDAHTVFSSRSSKLKIVLGWLAKKTSKLKTELLSYKQNFVELQLLSP